MKKNHLNLITITNILMKRHSVCLYGRTHTCTYTHVVFLKIHTLRIHTKCLWLPFISYMFPRSWLFIAFRKIRCSLVNESCLVSINTYHRLCGLNNKNLLGGKSIIKMLANLVPDEILFLLCRWPLSCCVLELWKGREISFSFYKASSTIWLGPHYYDF